MDTTNEPVAWMLLRDEVCSELTEWFGDMRGWEEFLGDNEKIVELYTHPVKDLEDIDINITWNENSMRDFGKDELAFARAILRKAQEK